MKHLLKWHICIIAFCMCFFSACNSVEGLTEQNETKYEVNSSDNTIGAVTGSTPNAAFVSEQTNEKNNAEIIAEIKQTLADFRKFSYSYLQCKAYMFGENLDESDTLTVDGRVYYRAVGGEYTSYSKLMAAIDLYCSEEVISECDLKKYCYYGGENDSLYIWADADSNGGVMGYDTAYITSLETLDDGSVKVNLTAWGDKDEWGYEDGDSVITFEITMKSENGLWKIDKCGLMEMDYITWLFDADMTEITVLTTSTILTEQKIEFYDNTSPADSKNIYDMVKNMIDEANPPEINISNDSRPYEILLAGKTAAAYYGEMVDKYFEYNVSCNWKMASGNEAGDIYTDENSVNYYKCCGLYTDRANDIYVPMDFSEVKDFLISYMFITESCFYDLCENSPSKYIDVDNVCYLKSGDGGQAGWDYSYIKNCEVSEGGELVTYFCERVGKKDNWGYDEDLIKPFSFSIAKENDIWKLNSCSDCEAFSDYFIGLESDIENNLNISETAER